MDSVNPQNGGIMITTGDSDAFNHFLNNCKISFLTVGANGVTLVARLNSTATSNYIHMDSNHFGKPVKKLLIKLYFIKSQEPTSTVFTDINNQDKVTELATLKRKMLKTTVEDFTDEVNKQTDIFFKTMNYLQPICPATVYSQIFSNPNLIIQIIMNKSINDPMANSIMNDIYTNYQNGNVTSIGLIAMEFANNYKILHHLIDDQNFKLYQYMARYLLIRLAVETGYTQADFHMANIMINTKSSNYFKHNIGSPLLIDFGYAKKIPESTMEMIKRHYEIGSYTEILRILCTIDRPDGIKLTNYLSFYGWACGYYDVLEDKKIDGFDNEDLNIIDFLFQMREMAIDELVENFDKLHNSNPNKYPLLPLSNAIKNSLYNGMIEGGNRKIWKNNKTRKNKKSKKQRKTIKNKIK